MKNTPLILFAIFATLLPASRSVAVQGESFLTRVNTVKEGDWRTARAIATELVGNSSDTIYTTLRKEWGKIEQSVVRQEIVRTFLTTVHPDSLTVALLGLEDRNLEVRKSTVESVAYALGLPYSLTLEQAKTQVAARQNRTLEQVREERVRETIVALRSARSEAVPDLLGAPFNSLWESKRLREIALQTSFLDALRPHLIRPETTPAVQEAILGALRAFNLPDSFLGEIFAFTLEKSKTNPELSTSVLIFLGSKRYRPAYESLKAQLQQDIATKELGGVRFATAHSLGQFGEPELVPFMIGIIAAENKESVYNVGYYGLGPLTGVSYNETHDGEWWKLWWELHKSELPESVRDLPIPTFPRSPRYQDPLSREVHADRAKFRSVLVALYQERLNAGLSFDGATLSGLGGAAEIPTLIGLIASDNTSHSIYNIGYFGLTPLTGVPYSKLHDGNWWKLWYEAHKGELPDAAQMTSLPEFPRSHLYREPLAKELHNDPDRLREQLIADLRRALAAYTDKTSGTFLEMAQRVEDLKDPQAVPEVITLLPELGDPKEASLYPLEYFILSRMTGVRYEKNRGHVWWAKWWQENKATWEKRYPSPGTPPDYKTLIYRPGQPRTKSVIAADCVYDPQVSPDKRSAATVAGSEAVDENPQDIADVPSIRYLAGDDKDKVYRLVGLDPKAPAPKEGYSLLVILPGGEGSDEFRWFIRRIKKNALPKNMLVAQLIAPQWSEWQAKNLVWPTRKNPAPGMKFSTEEFIEATIADVKKKTNIAPTHVYTMAWSSSGPAVYTHLATKGSSVAGAFVAMSVFRPQEMPAPENLRGKRVSLYHSPQDFIKIQQAHDAETFLKAQGAVVRFEEYQGGHGWRGDTFGAIRAAVDFLQASTP